MWCGYIKDGNRLNVVSSVKQTLREKYTGRLLCYTHQKEVRNGSLSFTALQSVEIARKAFVLIFERSKVRAYLYCHQMVTCGTHQSKSTQVVGWINIIARDMPWGIIVLGLCGKRKGCWQAGSLLYRCYIQGKDCKDCCQNYPTKSIQRGIYYRIDSLPRRA